MAPDIAALTGAVSRLVRGAGIAVHDTAGGGGAESKLSRQGCVDMAGGVGTFRLVVALVTVVFCRQFKRHGGDVLEVGADVGVGIGCGAVWSHGAVETAR